MRVLATLVFTFFTSVIAQATDVFHFIEKGIQKEVAAVKQPVDETIAFVGSSQCSNVKKLIGVSYEQIKGEKEPDLRTLSLVYKTRVLTSIINITGAAELLQQARGFDSDQRLVIFIHGFTDDPTKDSFGNISLSFFNTGYSSIIALDGSSLIRWLYLRSTTYVRFMGERLGQLLAVLVDRGQDPDLIHIIGHSLGAHISGFAGKTFHDLTGKLVGRISGLDPAGPCFSHVDPELRLKHTDAKFVDVVHTDGGVYGMKDPVGHRDYYPNSGAMQPDCLFQTCSHSRSWLLYGESVLHPDAFPAVRCDDWEAFRNGRCEDEISYMGYPAKPGPRGQFFLQTEGEYPFGKGEEGLRFQNKDGIVKSVTNLFG